MAGTFFTTCDSGVERQLSWRMMMDEAAKTGNALKRKSVDEPQDEQPGAIQNDSPAELSEVNADGSRGGKQEKKPRLTYSNVSTPIVVMAPIFRKFQQLAEEPYTPNSEECKAIIGLLDAVACSSSHQSESSDRVAIEKRLSTLLSTGLARIVWDDQPSTNAIYTDDCEVRGLLNVSLDCLRVKEDEQSVVLYGNIFISREAMTRLRRVWNMPVFLLSIDQCHRLFVSGALLADNGARLEYLADGVHLVRTCGVSKYLTLARIFRALRECFRELSAQLEAVRRKYNLSKEVEAVPDRLFPEPHVEGLVFRGQLSDTMFTGTFKGNPCIVKYVTRYGEEAHRCLEQKGLAPRLFSCQKLTSEWTAVVMEELPTAKTLLDLAIKKSLSSDWAKEITNQLTQAVEALHASGFVFGDLRPKNVLVAGFREQVFARLCDFDWAAKQGSAYPLLMNTEVPWPDGASSGKPMMFEHDTEMLAKIRELMAMCLRLTNRS